MLKMRWTHILPKVLTNWYPVFLLPMLINIMLRNLSKGDASRSMLESVGLLWHQHET